MVQKSEVISVLSILAKGQGKTMLAKFSDKYSPFEVLISTILSARAKDEITEVISEKLFKKYKSPKALSKAKIDEVIKIIKPIGFYNNKAKNIINTSKMLVNDFNSKVPDSMENLLKFPGVGRKVASCVLVYSFQKQALPVDIHVHKIANRLGWVNTKSPNQTEKALEKLVPKKYWLILNDVFVTHGKTICISSKNPKCDECKIRKYCKRVLSKKVN